ncbi:cobalamin biosynthesis protein CobW [Acrocarpospora phusangensis]|uniref:Cobalamin biosynthesis protein CobW n=1 Tax=Acrocarpospora phusangensis TaxID=1070424 RepID=A0A919UN20_9ACTN|nr:GTP-binding protein [Acrocarpospora phusangensis]GIH22280.1 cobalamin biosynthesis protein CobW [Acrocarpospora phusangensis]
MPTPVVLVAGLHTPARSATVNRLLAAHPGAIAVHHDLREVTSGRIEREVRDSSGIHDLTQVRLAHACVTCTIREDLLPQLIRHADTASLLIVDLWDSVEPRSVAEALDEAPEILRLTGVLTALHTEHLPIDIARGERLAETGQAGAAGDRRYLAEVLARQIEYATALILHNGDREDIELARALLSHLAPVTPVFTDSLPAVTGPALHTRELAERVDPATAQLPCDARTGEVTTVVWHRLRPLHPARLFAAMGDLIAGSVRSRGRFWLATRHDRLLAWDSVAGAMSVADAGPWLAALPETSWDQISPARRVAAALDWTDPLGDRVQHLVFTGPDLDRDRIHTLLDSCLLTPAEAVSGSHTWSHYEDPFSALLT